MVHNKQSNLQEYAEKQYSYSLFISWTFYSVPFGKEVCYGNRGNRVSLEGELGGRHDCDISSVRFLLFPVRILPLFDSLCSLLSYICPKAKRLCRTFVLSLRRTPKRGKRTNIQTFI